MGTLLKIYTVSYTESCYFIARISHPSFRVFESCTVLPQDGIRVQMQVPPALFIDLSFCVLFLEATLQEKKSLTGLFVFSTKLYVGLCVYVLYLLLVENWINAGSFRPDRVV